MAKQCSPDAPEVPSTSSVKLCVICSDKANGMHFGALTCEGCKGFFRRSVKKNAHFICAFEKKCKITKVSRKHCQACRYKACIEAGMQTSLILSDEEVQKKRLLIKKNKEKRMEQQVKQNEEEQTRLQKVFDNAGLERHSLKMTMEDKLLIETLVKGHYESYDFGYREYDTFRGREQIDLPPKKSEEEPDIPDVSLAWLTASLNNANASGPDLKKYKEYEDKVSSNRLQKRKALAKSPVPMSPDVASACSSSSSSSSSKQDISKEVETTAAAGSPSLSSTHSTATSQSSSSSDVFGSLHGTSVVEQQAPKPEGPIGDVSLKINEPFESQCDKMVQNVSECLLRSQGVSLNDINDSKSRDLLQHFADIMTWGIKKVIHFCKSIPEFVSLSLGDQIVLLRGGCLELLVLRSYFAFASEQNSYISEKFQYKPSDFLQAGASQAFIENYNNLHIRMRKMKFQVEEICLLLALVLFSPDRTGLESKASVEEVQIKVVSALRAYEYTHKPPDKARTMYGEILLTLPLLRTINSLFSENITELQKANVDDINPLILEVNSDSD